jgi:hypothetical protein
MEDELALAPTHPLARSPHIHQLNNRRGPLIQHAASSGHSGGARDKTARSENLPHRWWNAGSVSLVHGKLPTRTEFGKVISIRVEQCFCKHKCEEKLRTTILASTSKMERVWLKTLKLKQTWNQSLTVVLACCT